LVWIGSNRRIGGREMGIMVCSICGKTGIRWGMSLQDTICPHYGGQNCQVPEGEDFEDQQEDEED
jgi:hypothetical protein